jgi:raffinose/stachyose/melibiose transport system substrate-binding protein
MRNKSRIFCGATAIVMCLAFLGGCADKSSGPEVYIDENVPDVVISLFVQNTAVSEAINECCANINGDSNIILYSDDASYYAEDGLSYRELLLKRQESGQGDDMYIIPAEDVLEFDRRGYIYDMSGLPWIENLSEDARQQSTYRGKVFSIPMSYSCFGLIWNVDLLRQYDLNVPENLNEFWNVCETLKQNGILPYGANRDFGVSLPAMCVGLAPLYRDPESERLLEELSSGKTAISRYMRSGFEFLQTMIDRGYLDAEQALATLPGSDEEAALFAEGKCAFISSLCRGKAFRSEYEFEVRMTALPVLEDGAICVVGADNRLAVNPNSEHLEEALLVLERMCTEDSLNEFSASLRTISSARGNMAATLPQADSLVACVAEGGQIPNQDFNLYFNTWNTIKELCVKLCEGASVDEVCQEYDERQQQEIEAYCE